MRHDIWWFSLRLRGAGLRLGVLVGSGDGLAGRPQFGERALQFAGRSRF